MEDLFDGLGDWSLRWEWRLNSQGQQRLASPARQYCYGMVIVVPLLQILQLLLPYVLVPPVRPQHGVQYLQIDFILDLLGHFLHILFVAMLVVTNTDLR